MKAMSHSAVAWCLQCPSEKSGSQSDLPKYNAPWNIGAILWECIQSMHATRCLGRYVFGLTATCSLTHLNFLNIFLVRVINWHSYGSQFNMVFKYLRSPKSFTFLKLDTCLNMFLNQGIGEWSCLASLHKETRSDLCLCVCMCHLFFELMLWARSEKQARCSMNMFKFMLWKLVQAYILGLKYGPHKWMLFSPMNSLCKLLEMCVSLPLPP